MSKWIAAMVFALYCSVGVAAEVSTIGVLAAWGKDRALTRWQPTANYLSQRIQDRQFRIQAMTLAEMKQAVGNSSVDFIITNSGNFVQLQVGYNVSQLATLVSKRQGQVLTVFGAAIFTRANRSDINDLKDLRGKSFMAVNKDAFGGFQMAWRELKRQKVDPFIDFSTLKFSGFPQDRVVLAVRDGEVDAGTVRSDTLERMAKEGAINLKDFKVIPYQSLGYRTRNDFIKPFFPFAHSTAMYPEWPFARLEHVPLKLAKEVQLALLKIEPESKVAIRARSAGWTVPLDYQPIHDLMKELNIGPYEHQLKDAITGFIRQYWAFLAVSFFLVIPGLVVYVRHLSGQLGKSRRTLSKVEAAWSSSMDFLRDPICLIGLDGKLIRANKAFCQLMQKDWEELKNQTVSNIFHPDGEDLPCPVCQARKELRDTAMVVEESSESNHLGFPMEVSLQVVRDKAGVPMSIVQAIRDLSEDRKEADIIRGEKQLLESIVEGTAGVVGEDFFDSLVSQLAKTLKMRTVMLAEAVREDGHQAMHVRAMWDRENVTGQKSYIVEGTPCKQVMGGGVVVHESNARNHYPNYPLLQKTNTEGMIAVPLFDNKKNVIGHIAVLNDKAITNASQLLPILKIFASRAAAEIEGMWVEEKFAAFLESTPDPLIISDKKGKIVLVNSQCEKVFGFSREELEGEEVEILLPSDMYDYHSDLRKGFMNAPVPRAMGSGRELIAQRRDGEWFPVEVSLSPVRTGDETLVIAIVRDISERKNADRKLRHLASFPELDPIPIVELAHTGRVKFLNPIAMKLFPTLEKEGFSHAIVNGIDELMEMDDFKSMTGPLKREIRAGNSVYEQYISYIADSDAIRIYCWDITSMHELTREMSYRASHDPLTGLINRQELEKRLESAVQEALYSNKEHALCYLDLDQFKVVNDTCGHVAGDELLRQVTALFKKTLRNQDVFARLGGDEFAVLLMGCPFAKATAIAEKLRLTVQEYRFAFEDKSFALGVSIGVVHIDKDTMGNIGEILSAADAACYAAKDQGRNQVYVYQPDDKVLLRQAQDMNWTHRIHEALAVDRLVLYQQAIIPLTESDQPYCEILVRMIDSNNELILPNAFIPAAERYGLMALIDQWVFRNTLIAMQDGTLDDISCSVNLSGQTLGNQEAMQRITNDLEKHEVNPKRICFEITETAMITNIAAAERYVKLLRGMGCKFALDDFGSGLSSFSYLKNLPVDILKIDGHIVKDIGSDNTSATMVEAIASVGHAMGLKIIAEYVENTRILDRLRKLNVDFAQGYAIAKPQPVYHIDSDQDQESNQLMN